MTECGPQMDESEHDFLLPLPRVIIDKAHHVEVCRILSRPLYHLVVALVLILCVAKQRWR